MSRDKEKEKGASIAAPLKWRPGDQSCRLGTGTTMFRHFAVARRIRTLPIADNPRKEWKDGRPSGRNPNPTLSANAVSRERSFAASKTSPFSEWRVTRPERADTSRRLGKNG